MPDAIAGRQRARLRRRALWAMACAGLIGAVDAHGAAQPEIRTSDVDRFFQVVDAAQGRPTAAALQAGYLDPGTAGLQEFVTSRIGSAAKLAEAIAAAPAVYENARGCANVLPQLRAQLPSVFKRLEAAYAEAAFPPVTVLIGRNSTGGTTTATGVVIGLETICRANWMQPDMEERLLHLVAHEYAHVQQPAAQADPPPGSSLLFQSLIEGGAEFIAELTSGSVSNSQLTAWTRGRECRIEQDFEKAAAGSDVTGWLYGGPGDAAHPGDLGYWVGYRIVKAYYAQASDKRRAVHEILAVNDRTAADFQQRSGWHPARPCPKETP